MWPCLSLIFHMQLVEVVVDRVEGSWIIVEWPDGDRSDLPVALFPLLQEGDRVRVKVRRTCESKNTGNKRNK